MFLNLSKLLLIKTLDLKALKLDRLSIIDRNEFQKNENCFLESVCSCELTKVQRAVEKKSSILFVFQWNISIRNLQSGPKLLEPLKVFICPIKTFESYLGWNNSIGVSEVF